MVSLAKLNHPQIVLFQTEVHKLNKENYIIL